MRGALRSAAAIFAACLLGICSAQTLTKADLYIDAAHQAKAETAMAALGSGAVMMPREKGSPVLRIRVSEKARARAKDQLRALGLPVVHETLLPMGTDGLSSRTGIKSHFLVLRKFYKFLLFFCD